MRLLAMAFPLSLLVATVALPAQMFGEFDVLDIVDGRTLLVRWSESRLWDLPLQERVTLAGIWSDAAREPRDLYDARVRFLTERLAGRRTRVSQRGQTIVISNTPITYAVITTPAEVVLADGTNLNELLLRSGHAILDLSHELFADEEERYRTALADARTARRGLWALDETAQRYHELASQMPARPRRATAAAVAPSGFRTYVGAQAVLLVFILVLTWVGRRQPETVRSTITLMTLPFMLVLPYGLATVRPFVQSLVGEALRLQGRRNFPSDEDYLWTAYWLSFVILAYAWARALVVLVRDGPLGEWRSLWSSSGARRALILFFLGLWGLTAGFGGFYRLAQPDGSLGEGLALSASAAFNLGAVSGSSGQPARDALMLVQKILLVIWIVLCGTLIPRVERHVDAGSGRVAILIMSLSSLAVLSLVVASAFTTVFWVGGLASRLDTCFWFALASLFRQPFGAAAVNSPRLQAVQVLEVHVGFFLSVVGFRAIFALALPPAGRDT